MKQKNHDGSDNSGILPSPSKSRRGVLNDAIQKVVVVSTATTALDFGIFPTFEANAAAPVTVQEAENFEAKVQRLIRPKPPKLLRPQLEKDFAVLLMRSSYNALDQLDCVAMDQFQRDFFIIRQAEYEPYVNLLGPGFVKQGELTDPYYFDFISFAQYCTINREISKDPPYVFKEQQPVEVGEGEPQQFVTKIIRRDPNLLNDKLAEVHSSSVGVSIIDYFEKVFGDSPAGLPKIAPNARPNTDTLYSSLSQLVKLFLINGFAWDGNVSISTRNGRGSSSGTSGTEFTITLKSPATIWSGKALQLQRAGLLNSFVLKAATTLVSRAGYEVASSSIKYDADSEVSSFTIR